MAYFIPVTTNEGTSCYVLPAPQVIDDSGSAVSLASVSLSSSSVTKSKPATCVSVLSTNNPVTVVPPTSASGLVHGHHPHHHHHHVQHHHGPLVSTGTTVLALPTPEGGYTLATASTTPGTPGVPVTTSKHSDTLVRASFLFYCIGT